MPTTTKTAPAARPAAAWMCASALCLAGLAAPLHAQTTLRASVASGGAQGNADSTNAMLSGDGRYVAFASAASGLVPGDTNFATDIFVRDLQLGTTERVSLSAAGLQAVTHSDTPSISADGRFVAFFYRGSDLVLGDTNGRDDVYVRDRLLGTTERVSVGTGGTQGDDSSYAPSISADGRYVVFESLATNFVPGDVNGNPDTFVRDRALGTTECVSVGLAGLPGNDASLGGTNAAVSADGRFVVFSSFASNLVAADTNATGDVFVRDRLFGLTERASVGPGGLQANGQSSGATISPDGRWVALDSFATNLIVGDTNAVSDVFLRDRQAGVLERVSIGAGGAQANSDSGFGSSALSADGRYVAFVSNASNLVPGDTNVLADVFVRDRLAGLTERASVHTSGAQADTFCSRASLSADGHSVAFDSAASTLVTGDTNFRFDVFVRLREQAFSAFCFGDGPLNGGPDCPCANNVPIGVARGCTNSTGNGGLLAASGNASLSADSLTLTGVDLAPASFALFLQSPTDSGAAPYFFDGLRCVGPSFVRLTTKQSVAGRAAIGAPSTPVSVLGGVAGPGTQFYQVVYRNNAGPCNLLANSTNGVAVAWAP